MLPDFTPIESSWTLSEPAGEPGLRILSSLDKPFYVMVQFRNEYGVTSIRLPSLAFVEAFNHWTVQELIAMAMKASPDA